MLAKYISKLPAKLEIIYVRPLEKFSDDGPWYSAAPLGKHTLHLMLKKMCTPANIPGNKTNHSLRGTAATEFQCGVPGKLIQEWTGHQSLEALRSYEKVKINTFGWKIQEQ